jgi:N6-adenosine-specific RNA methylase IME4
MTKEFGEFVGLLAGSKETPRPEDANDNLADAFTLGTAQKSVSRLGVRFADADHSRRCAICILVIGRDRSRAANMTEWPFGNLRPISCDVIVADPPWDFENYSAAGTAKGADAHYSVMALDAIKALPVGQLARGDCLLLLWTCGWAIATGQAQAVARAWGFVPQSEMVWRKLTINGKPRMGTGYRVRTLHEPILVCTIGAPKHTPLPSLFDGVAREHSRKPTQFYEIVREATPQAMRRADLFSRETREGFEGWGNEHGKFDGTVAAAATM